tara:strand:- start:257 stop:745 length:489 start_codon:yes stop_codon:yes gene_type:complete
MAFKMSKPSMINISYNKENSGVSPLHKETDPKDKEKARLAGKKAGEMEAMGSAKQPQTPKAKAKRKIEATKRKSKLKVKTVNTIKSKDVVNKGKMSLLDKPKASTLKTTKDVSASKDKKKTISGAEALKKAKEMRSDKKKNKKSSSKDKRKQERADKIMSKL